MSQDIPFSPATNDLAILNLNDLNARDPQVVWEGSIISETAETKALILGLSHP